MTQSERNYITSLESSIKSKDDTIKRLELIINDAIGELNALDHNHSVQYWTDWLYQNDYCENWEDSECKRKICCRVCEYKNKCRNKCAKTYDTEPCEYLIKARKENNE